MIWFVLCIDLLMLSNIHLKVDMQKPLVMSKYDCCYLKNKIILRQNTFFGLDLDYPRHITLDSVSPLTVQLKITNTKQIVQKYKTNRNNMSGTSSSSASCGIKREHDKHGVFGLLTIFKEFISITYLNCYIRLIRQIYICFVQDTSLQWF